MTSEALQSKPGKSRGRARGPVTLIVVAWLLLLGQWIVRSSHTHPPAVPADACEVVARHLYAETLNPLSFVDPPEDRMVSSARRGRQ